MSSTKMHVFQALVLSVLLYVLNTAADKPNTQPAVC